MVSKQLLERQAARESNARTYARSLNLALVKGQGLKVTDADGKEYYDCLAAAGTLALGHNHPVVKEAIKQALDADLPMQTLDLTSPVKDAFVEEIFSTLPPAFAARARIQFCGPTGADANEAAIKLVKTASSRQGMMAFHGGYHGMTLGTLSVSGNLGPKTEIGGLVPGVQFMPYPTSYRSPFGIGGELGHQLCSRYLESLLEDPESGVHVAGLVAELVQGEGGVHPAPDEWTREIRRITKAHNLPMIIDEVQTGAGRTGAMWAVDHSGIMPDVMVMSKAIGGGLPLSVIVYDQDLDQWQAGAHAGTFRGNQLAMASGLATLRYIRAHDLPAHATKMGEKLRAGLTSLQSDYPWLGDVRGRGLMVGVEIVDPSQSAGLLGEYPNDSKRAKRLRAECLARGLILELGGRHSSVVRFLPPLIITEQDIEAVLQRFGDAAKAANQMQD